MLSRLLLFATAAAGSATDSVERWRIFELNLTGPAASAQFNPFAEVDLQATFTLDNPSLAKRPRPAWAFPRPTAPAALPAPLVALDFGQAKMAARGNGTVANTGSSQSSAPIGQVINASPSGSVPAGSPGLSLDFGADVADRHVVELPGDHKPFRGGLAGLNAFTVTGWLNPRGSTEGAGGNRVLNYCGGGGGIDLVWDSGGGGRLKLAVNEWPDGDHPTSSGGTMPAGSSDWPRWIFFAVSYSTRPAIADSNVNWYFGNSKAAASRDATAGYQNYSNGAVKDPNLPLAFGNFGSGFHSNDRLFEGLMFQPRVWAAELTPAQVVAAQGRSGCAPDCTARSCGSDGCGGSCGSCYGATVCGNRGGGSVRCQANTTITVTGFYDGGTSYKIRFAPPFRGTWKYTTASPTTAGLAGRSGTVIATPASPDNHGPVGSDGFRLVHADGTPHFSVGSTSYQWTSKGFGMQRQTLETLRNGQGDGPVFNKLRMTVFPKWYEFNHANPVETGTAYDVLPGSVAANATAWHCVGNGCPSTEGSFDLTRFNVSYWHNYERLVGAMLEMGVVADIIVFHPYDSGHWGFDCMGGRNAGANYDTTHDNFYLKYLAARLASFSNVWWAMANEWSFCKCKSFGATTDNGPTPVWDELFQTLTAADPYGRQTSIHNGNLLYNHSRPWISHVSLQGHESDTASLRPYYGKPVIWDEVEYEGNIASGWGALSGEEEADRFWWGAALGVYVGHSETVLHPNIADENDQPLWWAKGGTLIGRSPSRIRWFRQLMSGNLVRSDFNTLRPSQEWFGDSGGQPPAALMLSTPGVYYLLHFQRPGLWTVPLSYSSSSTTATDGTGGRLPTGGASVVHMFCLHVLDYWNATVSASVKVTGANYTIDVPYTPFNAEFIAIGPGGSCAV